VNRSGSMVPDAFTPGRQPVFCPCCATILGHRTAAKVIFGEIVHRHRITVECRKCGRESTHEPLPR
jgi:RNase P subunit RPR2